MDAAASSNSKLEHLILRSMIEYENNGDYLRTLAEATPRFKTKKISLIFLNGSNRDSEELMLAALKKIYAVQKVVCLVQPGGPNWFSNENQVRVDFYLDRNRQLAQWIKHPELVPRELWSSAVTLALKAGANSLYQTLLVLS